MANNQIMRMTFRITSICFQYYDSIYRAIRYVHIELYPKMWYTFSEGKVMIAYPITYAYLIYVRLVQWSNPK